MIDYLKWRGDLPFSQFPFCEADALIFAWISYYAFEELVKRGVDVEGLRLAQIARLHESHMAPFRRVDPYKKPLPRDNAELLFAEAATTQRFGTVMVERFHAEFDPHRGKQFAAVALQIDGLRVIAYRGTDTSVAGWKEDCRIAYEAEVPAQHLATAFLNHFHDRQPMIICGHSKGGNLALHAALNARGELVELIRAVYDLDGPGFRAPLEEHPRYARLKDRLHAIVPQDSVIGFLLYHPEDYTVVKADLKGLVQHNGFCWHILGTDFVRAEVRSTFSLAVESILHRWLNHVSFEEREELVSTLFSVFENAGIGDFAEMNEEPLHNLRRIFSEANHLSHKRKKDVLGLLGELLGQCGESITSILADWIKG